MQDNKTLQKQIKILIRKNKIIEGSQYPFLSPSIDNLATTHHDFHVRLLKSLLFDSLF
jgi:hypothetical protein